MFILYTQIFPVWTLNRHKQGILGYVTCLYVIRRALLKKPQALKLDQATHKLECKSALKENREGIEKLKFVKSGRRARKAAKTTQKGWNRFFSPVLPLLSGLA